MFELYSRVQRIGGNGAGYRDIVIHEMTEGEIKNLKEGKWLFALGGFALGFITGAAFVIFSGPYPNL